MSAHTSGPWDTSAEAHDEDGEPAFYAIKDKRGREVANTCSGDFLTPIEFANARLIAAAPELLAVAKKALAVWTGEGPAIVLDELRAAIAKAEAA